MVHRRSGCVVRTLVVVWYLHVVENFVMLMQKNCTIDTRVSARPKKTEPNVYKVVLFCSFHASVCRMDGCNSRVCHVCKKKCPSCGKDLCHKHVVKRLCIGCMQEEADAYREKWPQHAQSEQLLE